MLVVEGASVVVGTVVEVKTTVVVCCFVKVVRGAVEVVFGAVEVVRGAVVVVVELERCAVVVGGAKGVAAALVVRLGFAGFTVGSETTAPATPPVPAAGARCGCRWRLAAA